MHRWTVALLLGGIVLSGLFAYLLLDELVDAARASPRRRRNLNFHRDAQAAAQRLLNAIEPGSYVQPHRHLDPSKDETFVVLRGSFGLVLFDEAGTVVQTALLAAGVDVRCLRDLTRGGLASVLNEIAEAAGVRIQIEESAVPVREDVHAACEMLGLDPLHVANEGRFVCFVAARDAEDLSTTSALASLIDRSLQELRQAPPRDAGHGRPVAARPARRAGGAARAHRHERGGHFAAPAARLTPARQAEARSASLACGATPGHLRGPPPGNDHQG